ncbi:MAG: type IV toxin-antitoxin system AbiEi family antitoxin [Rhodospirillaceae bacterium]|nr:type IV toxin-antitoxin system AbiEi family antitoxin [Rhodospirillaceae bacterium]
MTSRASLASYLLQLQSAGRLTFTREEAQAALGIGQGAFLDAAERLQRRHLLVTPRRGFYVVVPPSYLAQGAPPPSWFIDAMMERENRPYYVGLLKAAELHGASHQAAMAFQVVTDKTIPEIRAGRSLIAFIYRKDFQEIESGIEKRKVDTGWMKLASVELTALDIVRYPRAAGGLGNIVTVLADLAPKIDALRLRVLADGFERSVVQRLGFLLTHSGHADRAELLKDRIRDGSQVPWVELDPREASDPDFAPDIVERNKDWRVIVRTMPEADT